MVFLIGFPLALYLLWTKVLAITAQTEGFAAYSMVSMATYGSMGGALFVGGAIALERAAGWLRYLAMTPLPRHGYLVAKVVAGALGVLPSIVVILGAGALLAGVRLPMLTWVALVPLIWVGVLPFAALGVAFGYSLQGPAANIAMMVVYFGLSILGGLWLPVRALPRGYGPSRSTARRIRRVRSGGGRSTGSRPLPGRWPCSPDGRCCSARSRSGGTAGRCE
ncbi:hypothetical protein C1I98_29290 [Spongiactinospora gelatinilytica]|uniref:ABC transporter permease n=1 Tax=Spongiactinospora gelatinilytica TaxID=2666298 RepID=A0A2W2G548_9ACTN|nr:ABC transporter permease [Spongiactinospora gelatinilytica]PZG32530.1 hypothetical protein C1I98_29290 [Spongiactinospora gelatinilytica]